jgi:hypothetical protein
LLIVTTNLPFGEWTKVFPDAHIIDTGTESWRFGCGLANPED